MKYISSESNTLGWSVGAGHLFDWWWRVISRLVATAAVLGFA